MESKKILQADYLDIVFDNRNKAYGGYQLRKDYSSRTRKALLLVVLSTTLLLSYFSWLTHRSPAAIISTVTGRVAELTDIKIHKLQKQIIPTTPPPQPAQSQPATVHQNTVPVIAPNTDVTIIDHPSSSTPTTTPGTSPNTSTIPGTGDNPNSTSTSSTTTKTTSTIVGYAEVMPSFRGDMYKFLGDHLRYPEEAKRAAVEGKVYVKFVVNEDGSITDATVVRGNSDYGLGDEAIRVINSMPKWNPGRQNNVPVKVYYTIPIVFVLQ